MLLWGCLAVSMHVSDTHSFKVQVSRMQAARSGQHTWKSELATWTGVLVPLTTIVVWLTLVSFRRWPMNTDRPRMMPTVNSVVTTETRLMMVSCMA